MPGNPNAAQASRVAKMRGFPGRLLTFEEWMVKSKPPQNFRGPIVGADAGTATDQQQVKVLSVEGIQGLADTLGNVPLSIFQLPLLRRAMRQQVENCCPE